MGGAGTRGFLVLLFPAIPAPPRLFKLNIQIEDAHAVTMGADSGAVSVPLQRQPVLGGSVLPV